MRPFFHLSSAVNRGSIRAHGLDASRMDAARGIAGSERPEADGVFVCDDEFGAMFFARPHGGPVDLWVFDADEDDLVDGDAGYSYLPGVIAPERLTLLRQDVVAPSPEPSDNRGAYSSTLTITYDDPSEGG